MNKEKLKITAIVIFSILFVIFVVSNWKLIKKIFDFSMNSIKFSLNVATHLSKLHPEYKGIFEDFLSGVIALGYTPQINSSYRTFAEQQIQYNANPSNARAGYSYHNYGLAIDMQMKKDGVTYGKSTSDAIWLGTGVPQLAKSLGLTWGGDNSVFGNYQDAVHFDYRVKKTSQLLAIAYNQFGNNPINIKGNELKFT